MAPKRKAGGSSSYTTVDLSELFSRLNLASSSEDFDRVVDISNEILKSSPRDVRAAKEKITALIKLDKYKDAYDFIQASTFLDDADTVLERGFCLYKLGKGAEAQEVLEGSSGRAAQHIKAQNVCS
jgi:signal recognition particle subunit SRP72